MRGSMTSERRAASELHARLRGGEFVVTAEITPPVSTDPEMTYSPDGRVNPLAL